MDPLEVGAIENGRINAPDRCRCRQEALKRVLATPAAFSRFSIDFLRRGWRWGGMCLFHTLYCCWGVAAGDLLVVDHPREFTLLARLAQWDWYVIVGVCYKGLASA
jgi:hypothetical protein